ncbi:MAG: magnesium transporter [Ruminococcus sp.]|nr:magnesium transporter [Ruminococcus sp.]
MNFSFLKEKAFQSLENKRYLTLKNILQDMNPADLALLFQDMEKNDVYIVFRLLPKEVSAETFSYMDSEMQMHLISIFSDSELSEVIDQLYLDDTVDLIEEMPANFVSRIIKNANDSTRKMINEILKYPNDSAGSIMTVEYVYLHKDMCVKESIEKIRSVGWVKETIYNCYVTDSRKLIGVVTLLDLLTSEDDTKISDIMDTNIISVNTYEHRESVAKKLSKYDFMAIPVVDNEERLVGIITFDDVMDVFEEEATEDIEKMAGISHNDESYFKTSVFKHVNNRMFWLMFLMLSSTITGLIIDNFQLQIATIPLLVSFMPTLMGTGGNCGSQSSALIIRGLSVDEIQLKDFFKVIFKEFRIALVCSIILAVVNGVRIYLMYKDIQIAIVVSLALIFTVIISKIIGCSLPMLAKRLKIDPTIMATPIISTCVDASSMFIYFTLATKMLNLA